MQPFVRSPSDRKASLTLAAGGIKAAETNKLKWKPARAKRSGCNGSGMRRSGFKDMIGCRDEVYANSKKCDKLAIATCGKTGFALTIKTSNKGKCCFGLAHLFDLDKLRNAYLPIVTEML